MSKTRNIFISHQGEDDDHVQGLKKRLTDKGNVIRNSSVDSTKHTANRPSDETIKRTLKDGISWAGTFVCLIGEKTHESEWVDYEIKQAHLQGKTIVGVFLHGCKDDVELPKNLVKYGGPILGWNSLDKLEDAMDGKPLPSETPEGDKRKPVFSVERVKCNKVA